MSLYLHVTDTMRVQASVKIDRKIGGTDAPMPEARDEPRIPQASTVDENFEPYKPKIRKSGTGCVYQINDTLWEGASFQDSLMVSVRMKRSEMIAEKKAEIAEMKKAKAV